VVEVKAGFPKAFKPLLEPHRYKVFYGGRGSGKSWSFATVLISLAANAPRRILCTRETMSSIRDSVHQLLSDRIHTFGLDSQFTVEKSSIRHRNGSEFIFAGLRHNVAQIRSLEGIDICWCEEAANITNASWEVLIPTVRKDGSEIWLSFNPVLETDATYERFVKSQPANSVVRHVSLTDNPWFPEELRREAAELKQRDPDAWAHVYGGQCRHTLDGAIYARELRQAQEDDRIGPVPYDPSKPVSVYFDLGWADNTSIWFAQHIAGECRLIDFVQDSQRPFSHYVQVLQNRGYVFQTMWLPHDAEAKSLGTGRSIEEMARAAGWRVRIVPKLSVEDGINAVRTLFPTMWFDATRCADGVQALRHYRYDVDDNGQFSRKPLHDSASHASDALRYCAVAMTEQRRANYGQPAKAPPRLYGDRPQQTKWMGI
jgi:phage terminase large subunit